MKKFIIILAIIISILVLNKEEYVVIPKDSIRFRVIANSNSNDDQLVKKQVVNNVKNLLLNNNSSNLKESRKYIVDNLPKFEEIVNNTLDENETFHINYGKNYFPEKVFKGVKYSSGYYESLVITIGDGKGENFWCVLFPPLCLVDEEEVEYKSLIKELIEKYF
jgi:stage II sporulation protein R